MIIQSYSKYHWKNAYFARFWHLWSQLKHAKHYDNRLFLVGVSKKGIKIDLCAIVFIKKKTEVSIMSFKEDI